MKTRLTEMLLAPAICFAPTLMAPFVVLFLDTGDGLVAYIVALIGSILQTMVNFNLLKRIRELEAEKDGAQLLSRHTQTQ